MSMYQEIFEQPDCLRGLFASQRVNVEKIARAIQSHDIRYVFLAARGTSDNAGRYANYLWGAYNGLPVALATPSLFTYYQLPPKLNQALVVGISQSGKSPDIISVLEEGRRQGNLTLAITNAPESPLAELSDFVLDIGAGQELAVAATKSYTSQLMAIAMLSAALAGDRDRWRELERASVWVNDALKLDGIVQQSAQRYRYMQSCVVIGRGYNYATAFEWALKLKELTYVKAEPYSSADFLHGPVAMVSQGFPVMIVLPTGKMFPSMMELVQQLSKDLLAELVIISNSQRALSMAKSPFTITSDVPEWISPMVSIIPAQLFSYHLALAKGHDADQPRSISKITKTR
jgi:glucosamine--fructose-6-phosphate aminotransferase (isomerizing)